MEFQRKIALASYTSLKIGGPAEFLCEAGNESDVAQALTFARKQGLAVHILGGGTNTFFADEGVRGMMIIMRNREITVDGTHMTIGAGIPMGEIVAKSIQGGLAGLAWAGGLPGTIGGAIFGNAGTFGSSIGDVVEKVRVMYFDGRSEEVPGSECGFSYRTSRFKKERMPVIILSVTLNLQRGDAKKLREEMMDAIRFRNERHPAPSSAGSFFKNPSTSLKANPEFLRTLENGEVKQWFGRVPAGWLIEHAGLKGARVGGAKISEKHANFLVNTGHATAKDIRALASKVKDVVQQRYGVMLEEEVRYLQ